LSYIPKVLEAAYMNAEYGEFHGGIPRVMAFLTIIEIFH
jgi:hypothetical protein